MHRSGHWFTDKQKRKVDHRQGHQARKSERIPLKERMYSGPNPLYHTQRIMQKEMKMKKINPITWETKSHILAAGYTQKEAVELTHVLGYEIIWRKCRDD
jgi:hypothetical protein